MNFSHMGRKCKLFNDFSQNVTFAHKHQLKPLNRKRRSKAHKINILSSSLPLNFYRVEINSCVCDCQFSNLCLPSMKKVCYYICWTFDAYKQIKDHGDQMLLTQIDCILQDSLKSFRNLNEDAVLSNLLLGYLIWSMAFWSFHSASMKN